ncbi:MAG: hypothetical protein WA432_02825 [Candidatus Babeliaceae bacterium]
MFSWQRSINDWFDSFKDWVKKHLLLSAFLFTGLIHLIFLIILFCINLSENTIPVFRVQAADADVAMLFIPTRNTIMRQKNVSKKEQGAAHRSTSHQKEENPVIQKSKKAQKAVASLPAPAKKKTTKKAIKKNENEPIKAPLEKLVSEKEHKKVVLPQQKNEEKQSKSVPEKAAVPSKKKKVKEIHKAKKIEGSEQLKPIHNNETPSETKAEILKEAEQIPEEKTSVASEEMVYAVDAENGSEAENNGVVNRLQGAFQAHWHPPFGSDNTFCTYKVLINKQGKVEEAHLIESSGMLIFEVSARAALMKVAYPLQLWGKEIILKF